MTLLIIDYGMGNLSSARRSLEECGAQVTISDDPASIKTAERLVLPGVGSFAKAMTQLNERGWTTAIQNAVRDQNIPILGICLGMQLLASYGEEGGGEEGLDLVPGRVVRMKPEKQDERIPHIGWNEVEYVNHSPLFENIPDASDFYFVHSYHFDKAIHEDCLGMVPYCGGMVAAIGRGNIYGTQFHPEKSSRAGLKLLSNFISLTC